MVCVCFHGTDNYEWQNQWDYVLHNFQPDSAFIIGDRWESKVLDRLLVDKLPRYKKVTLAPKSGRYVKGIKSLSEYKHPKNAIYIFGSDESNLEESKGDLVYIDTNEDMYSFVTAAVTLYDRKIKSG